jgi:catechol 2,3-dioxygenase-like lactoylglutathione lyase family enzyme
VQREEFDLASRLSHLFMSTTDLDASRRLFVGLLGLEILMDEGGYLRVGGGGGFHLGIEEGESERGPGLEIVVAVDDVDQAYLVLESGGVAVEAPPEEQPWGGRHFWFRDHDGRRFSVAGT